MILILLSFLSGVLTVLAPCVLPMLPVIMSGSFGDIKSRNTPYIIIASLTISLFLFSIALKVTTLFIDVPSSFWKYLSGGILIFLGVTFIFPKLWFFLSNKTGLEDESQKLLSEASHSNGVLRNILIGLSLGPVFSSCSPTYLLILSIILPANFFQGTIYLITYILGLSAALLAIVIIGKKCIQKAKWAVNPNGVFKKILGGILIFVGVGLILGLDKTLEANFLNTGLCQISSFEKQFIDNFKASK